MSRTIAIPPEFMILPRMRPPPCNTPGNLVDWEICDPCVSPPWRMPSGRLVRVAIRAGAHTDGASKPRWTWAMTGHPFSMPLLPKALYHDGWYSAELGFKNEGDTMFYDMMRLDGLMNRCECNLVWSGPRFFGGPCWRRHTEASIEYNRHFFQLIDADCTTPVWPEVPLELAMVAYAGRMVRASIRLDAAKDAGDEDMVA